MRYLEQLAADVRRRVLTRDAAPIWGFGSVEVSGLGSDARDALGDRLEVAGRFFTDQKKGKLNEHKKTFLESD